MSCPRCQGLMVPEHFFDLSYDGGCGRFDGWRCLCCGNILDPVILSNRQTVLSKASANTVLISKDNQDTLLQAPEGIVASAA